MREIKLDELKKIQIEILNEFDKFCKEHNLKYWLDCGTLLGAIRHQGYIPWDDDIDVGMLREDYDRCMSLFNNENTRYKMYSVENSKDFLYPFAKVIDTYTTLYEPNKAGNKLAVNIDVFVYDNAPDDEVKLNKMFSKRDFLEKMEYLRLPYNSTNRGLRRMVGELIRFVPRRFPKWYFNYKIIQNSKKYMNKSTLRVGNFTSLSRVVGDKKLFEDFVDVLFEGKYYKAPIGYDQWLKLFYKNYMELPPIEQRVPHHKFEAYWND